MMLKFTQGAVRAKYCFFLSLLILTSCADKGEVFQGGLCIEHITVIDAKNGLLPDRTVVIQEGKISQVVSSKDLKLSSVNQVVDGRGKFMIPGLWDAHVHFAYQEELAPTMLKLFMAYGITSVRDTGGEINFLKKLKDACAEKPTETPRIMIAGPLIDGLPTVYDGSDPGHPPLAVGANSVEDAVRIVDQLDSIGVDFIKAYEMLTPEQFKAVIARAHEKGLKVTGHVPLSMDVVSASNVGLNSMEHLRNLEMSMASGSDNLLKERLDMLEHGKQGHGGKLRSAIHSAQRMWSLENSDSVEVNKVLSVLAKNQTWQIPTLTIDVFDAYKTFATPSWQESFKYLPSHIEQRWKTEIADLVAGGQDPSIKEYADWMVNMIGEIHKAKIGIMAGTDCPIYYLTPGLSLHEELALLVKAGLSPLEAIETATLKPAQYFDLEKELGLIEEGMLADLLILDANPLTDIRNTTEINAVVKQGRMYTRQELDAMLEELDFTLSNS